MIETFRRGVESNIAANFRVSGVNLEESYESTSGRDTEQEFCVHDASGKRWLEVRNRRLFHQADRRGAPDKTILILRDITAQKRSEKEREAGRKAMALAEITTVLAHEIRNPLASLELFAELIEEDGDRRAEWISNLRAGIRSLSGTVNNVLIFHGSGALTLVPVMLPAMIGNAIRFVQPLAGQASVSLEFITDEQIQVMGNESAIQQIVLNLVSNAIRHTPAGGNVTVSLRREPNNESTAMQNGKSSSNSPTPAAASGADQIDHIFEPGFSGSGDTSGLGLPVCAQIMKQHGGRISASNRNHSGARFTLYFPLLQLELATA